MLLHALELLMLAQLGRAVSSRPNILFILTDDQDWHMESVDHMKYLKVITRPPCFLKRSSEKLIERLTPGFDSEQGHDVQPTLLHSGFVLSISSNIVDRSSCS